VTAAARRRRWLSGYQTDGEERLLSISLGGYDGGGGNGGNIARVALAMALYRSRRKRAG